MYKFSKMLVRNMNTTRKPLLPLSKIVRKQQDEVLLKPYYHIQKALCDSHIDILWSFNGWLPVPENKARAVEEFMRTFHLVTILIDDITDNSTVRWNVPAAHIVYSSALSINAAWHVMSMGLKKLTDLEPKAQGLIFERVTEFYRGQGIEIYWRDNATCPSEEEYIDMIHQKTSNVIHLSCQLRQLFSQNQTDYSKLGNLLGEYYQIRNDYFNLVDEQYEGNRAVCGDITEGKFTLPIIHAVKHSDVGSEVINIIKQRTQDIYLKKYCLSLLESVGSFQYTRDKLLKIETEIYNEMQNHGANPGLAACMDRLSDWKELSCNTK